MIGRALLLLASFAFAATAAAAELRPEGRYRLAHEPDVAAEILLTKDGRFAYALSAGALDEHAEGRWRREGKSIFLTTEPTPQPPVFRPASAAAAEGPITILVVSPGGDRGIAGVDVRVGFADSAVIEGYTQEDGWTADVGERRRPAWVELAVPMFGLASPRFPLDSAASRFVFELIPNDMGVVDFREAEGKLSKNRLLLDRGGYRMEFVRLKG